MRPFHTQHKRQKQGHTVSLLWSFNSEFELIQEVSTKLKKNERPQVNPLLFHQIKLPCEFSSEAIWDTAWFICNSLREAWDVSLHLWGLWTLKSVVSWCDPVHFSVLTPIHYDQSDQFTGLWRNFTVDRRLRDASSSQSNLKKEWESWQLTIFADGADHAGSCLQIVTTDTAAAVPLTGPQALVAAMVTPVGGGGDRHMKN